MSLDLNREEKCCELRTKLQNMVELFFIFFTDTYHQGTTDSELVAGTLDRELKAFPHTTSQFKMLFPKTATYSFWAKLATCSSGTQFKLNLIPPPQSVQPSSS